MITYYKEGKPVHEFVYADDWNDAASKSEYEVFAISKCDE